MTSTDKPVVYTIAGSDNSGGAGIQADLATFADFGVHGCSVITALTAQDRRGVHRVTPTPIDHLRDDFRSLREDMPPTAIKLGMLVNTGIAAEVASLLEGFEGPMVCDPVMTATAGGSLLEETAVNALLELLPRLALITPNPQEAETLTGIDIESFADAETAAQILLSRGARAVLITGGDLAASDGFCHDYFASREQRFWLRGERVASAHNHGTGCTLSAAVAAALALGYELVDAVVLAKMAVTQGLRAAGPIAGNNGCVAHAGWPAGLENLPAILPCRPDRFTEPAFPRCDTDSLGLYPVVDSADWVEKLLEAGVRTIQLRIKNMPERSLRREIERTVAVQKRYGARLFINDHWRLAIEQGAYGVHLGQEDIDTADLHAIAAAGLRLGLSNHAWYELARAHALRPSYMALGPIYSTTTKEMRFAPQGLEQLREWVDLLRPGYPLTAIGGIDLERAPAVAATGVGSIALVRAITEAADYRQATAQLAAVTEARMPLADAGEPGVA